MYRTGERTQKAEVAYVTDEYPSARGEKAHGAGQYAQEVVGGGEILDDRVEDDRVEPAGRESVGVVCGLSTQHDPSGECGIPRHASGQRVDHGTGQVGSPVGLAPRSQRTQIQPRPHTDLQNPPGIQGPDPLHGRITPLPHFPFRNRQTIITAVPPGEILPHHNIHGIQGTQRTQRIRGIRGIQGIRGVQGVRGIRGVCWGVEGVVELLPFVDLVVFELVLVGVVVGGVGVGEQVGDESWVFGAVFPEGDHGLADVRVLVEYCFDFTEFDPVAA